MSFIDNFLDKMKLGSNPDEDDDELYDDQDEDVVSDVRKKRTRNDDIFEDKDEEPEVRRPVPRPKPAAKPVARPASRPVNNGRVVRMNASSLEVCVIKPTNVEDGREIANTLLGGKAVVLNLEGIDVDLAQRIIDFTSGACFSINGNLQKVSNYIFIVTPESIDISGDFQGLITGEISLTQGTKF